MSLSTLLWFVVGLVLLIVGAEWMVRGSVRIAAALKVSPLTIGLTVVAFGTSAPELAVSLSGALSGTSELSVGNVVGSNLFNVLFVLGLSALVAPLVVAQRLVRVDVPLMIAASLLMTGLALDGRYGRLDGLLLFVLIVAYVIFAARSGRTESEDVQSEYAEAFSGGGRRHLVRAGLAVLAGLGMLAFGADRMVDSAVTVARALGVSEMVAGLTVVAVGTSLPELATSVVASLRGQRDIAVGNAIGSNLFNILAVLGLTALVSPEGLAVPPSALAFDLPVMTAVALATLPVLFTGYTLARWEGFLFLVYYVSYMAYVVLRAVEHDQLGPLSWIMGVFVGGLTAVTLGVVLVRELRRRPERAAG